MNAYPFQHFLSFKSLTLYFRPGRLKNIPTKLRRPTIAHSFLLSQESKYSLDIVFIISCAVYKHKGLPYELRYL